MADDAKATVRRFFAEVFGKWNFDVIDELTSEDFVEHQEFPGAPPGREGLWFVMAAFQKGFPDLEIDILAMVAEGDEVWIHAAMRGTHTGEFMGIPATDKKIDVPFVDRLRLVDGRAVEHWGVTDSAVMLQQMGILPAMS